MPTLHGFSYSNYYNIAKHVLLYKGVDFEEKLVYPGAAGYDKINPTGKVPSLTTDDGHHLAETSVLCEYIEETYPQKPLFPADAVTRNKVRQLMRISELYIELSSRRLLGFVLRQTEPPEALVGEVKSTLETGIKGINAIAKFDPWIIGDTFTMADIYLLYVLMVTDMCATYSGIDINQRIPGLADWRAKIGADPIAQRVNADFKASREDFFKYIKRNS